MEKSLEDYSRAGTEIYDKLRLLTYPVAIKYIKDAKEVPAGFVRPSANGQKWSLCQAFTYARRWRMSVAMTGEDNFCLPSSAAHRFIEVEPQDLIQSQVLNLWHKDLEAELKIGQHYRELMMPENIEKIQTHKGFLAMPLNKVDYIPDSVLIYGSPSQMTHILQALSYEGKHITRSGFIGYGESCIKGALLPCLTGNPEFVNPGAGDRSFSGTTEDEVAIGVPGHLALYVAENLFRSGGPFNIGQPIRTMLPGQLDENILPGWVFLKEKLQEKK